MKEIFKFSLCSRCNGTLTRIISTQTKKSNNIGMLSNLEIPDNIEVNSEICDLTITENKMIQNLSEISESDENNKIKTYSTDENNNYEIHYRVFIKLDGKFQPAKWYTIIVLEVDKFLVEIYTNVITLTKNKIIKAYDYHVSFKAEKALGVETQLVDVQDFQKFCSDYQKFFATKKNIGIFITINSQTLNKTKCKKKNNSFETEINTSEDNVSKIYKNKNKVSKISNLRSEETKMAKHVLEIRTANHCNIRNRACLNKDKSKENHIEIIFIMLSIWISEILYSTSNISEQPVQTTKLTIPTLSNFLKQVDKNENTNNYYQIFLVELKQQRISI
ncbi:21271_t:CDS:2 [Cetraspora pellucida]|uniref:21271_t:CDS:1 n=1 Tax=Cetraspora pellucida TaxID=1433469 RepID=A0A9N9J4J6_9GLOM|nr:21271_t:CDS:2 [Cetraspora pellucida]